MKTTDINNKYYLFSIVMTLSVLCAIAGSGTASHALAVSSAPSALTFPIVDTGQTKCYNASTEITSPGIGQPFYGQDAQFAGSQPSYTLSSDGKTIYDNVTKLTWMRGPNTTLTSPVSTDKKTYTGAQAWVSTVNALAYGGYSDWRLPSIKELYSLMNFKGTDPSSFTGTDTSVLKPFIDTRYFNFAYGQTSQGERIIDSQYASSNVFVDNPSTAGFTKLFGVNFADGRIKGYDLAPMPGSSTEKTFFVQLVRGPATYTVNSLTDNGDGTVSDASTGLMWSQADSGDGMTWQNALAWVQAKNTANYLGHNDWRLPNAKELNSLVDYENAPDFNGKPAIDTAFFTCTGITNENGDADYPYYWTSTTHAGYSTNGPAGGQAAYIPFGRALGWPNGAAKWVDVHGAGCQRSDPKTGPPYSYATTHLITKNAVAYTGFAFGPQGDALRGINFVRLVRDRGCTAAINGNLLLHIPNLSYANPISGNHFFWADFVCEFNPRYPTLIFFKYITADIIDNPSFSCEASTLSIDLKIHIPDVLLPDESNHLWVDLEYAPAFSTDGNACFLVTNYGAVSN